MRIKWFTYLVLAYLILASTWWTVLLIKKNQSEFQAKIQLSSLDNNLYNADELEKEYKSQRVMIIGEGLFLGGTLLVGMWLIYRGHKKELESIKQQNNFLLAITHELKSPVSSIDLILQTIRSRDLQKQQKIDLLDSGSNELKRLEEMIDNLLLSAQNNQNPLSLNTASRISDIIQDILIDIRNEDQEVDIKFLSELEKEERIQSDPELLSIAIKNVIMNAVKYCGPLPIKITLTKSNEFYNLSIFDQGPGIPDVEKNRIFEKFYRIGDEMTRSKKGTGLGLYLTKKIIKEHFGEIDVEDKLPTGSIFKIRLPINH